MPMKHMTISGGMEYCGRTILYVVDPNGVVILSD